MVERFEEPEPVAAKSSKLPLTRISAVIYCERSGQKAILIGKGGSKLKSIGAAARKEIESLLGTRVYLELHVIVEEELAGIKVLCRLPRLAQTAGRPGASLGASSEERRTKPEDRTENHRRSQERKPRRQDWTGAPGSHPAYLGRKRRAKPHHCLSPCHNSK